MQGQADFQTGLLRSQGLPGGGRQFQPCVQTSFAVAAAQLARQGQIQRRQGALRDFQSPHVQPEGPGRGRGTAVQAALESQRGRRQARHHRPPRGKIHAVQRQAHIHGRGFQAGRGPYPPRRRDAGIQTAQGKTVLVQHQGRPCLQAQAHALLEMQVTHGDLQPVALPAEAQLGPNVSGAGQFRFQRGRQFALQAHEHPLQPQTGRMELAHVQTLFQLSPAENIVDAQMLMQLAQQQTLASPVVQAEEAHVGIQTEPLLPVLAAQEGRIGQPGHSRQRKFFGFVRGTRQTARTQHQTDRPVILLFQAQARRPVVQHPAQRGPVFYLAVQRGPQARPCPGIGEQLCQQPRRDKIAAHDGRGRRDGGCGGIRSRGRNRGRRKGRCGLSGRIHRSRERPGLSHRRERGLLFRRSSRNGRYLLRGIGQQGQQGPIQTGTGAVQLQLRQAQQPGRAVMPGPQAQFRGDVVFSGAHLQGERQFHLAFGSQLRPRQSLSACQQGEIVDGMPAQIQRGAGQFQTGLGRTGTALHADVQTQGVAQGRQQGPRLGQQGRRIRSRRHGKRAIQRQRRGQHIRSGRKLQRPLTAQPHGPGIRLQALQRQHGTLTGPQGQFHPQGRRLPGR